jgi:Uma2 family endonuclease
MAKYFRCPASSRIANRPLYLSRRHVDLGDPAFADDQRDTVLNPIVIAEVLSPSTRDYELQGEFQSCRILPSLKEYVTVSQKRPDIRYWARQLDNRWLFTEINSIDAVLRLKSVNVALPLADIYERVLASQ